MNDPKRTYICKSLITISGEDSTFKYVGFIEPRSFTYCGSFVWDKEGVRTCDKARVEAALSEWVMLNSDVLKCLTNLSLDPNPPVVALASELEAKVAKCAN